MGSRDRPIDRGARRTRRILGSIGDELRQARVSAGLSQRFVASAAGLSHTTIGRIERGELRRASVLALATLSEIVGLELSVKEYAAGPPVRDRAHHALLERLRARLHPSLRWRLEVPLRVPGDRRAWDAAIDGVDWWQPVEAESRLRDVQALERRINLKCRDDDVAHVLLLVADTRSNRQVLAAAGDSLRTAFPADGRSIRAALAEGRRPGSGIILL